MLYDQVYVPQGSWWLLWEPKEEAREEGKSGGLVSILPVGEKAYPGQNGGRRRGEKGVDLRASLKAG